MSEPSAPVPAGGRRAAVLGSPIAHSLSPALHRAAYRSLGLDWTYEALEVDESELAAFLARLDDSWVGLSLTMPLKEAVIGLLDEVDEEARELSSVNTVLRSPEGGWRGANTDVYGIVQALREAGLVAPPSAAVVLGAGATARSALRAIVDLGGADVVICARRAEAAQELAYRAASWGLHPSISGMAPSEDLVRADLLINTLPGDAADSWAVLASAAGGALLDSSYHPWPTALASAWGGGVVASGRDMLLWQAVQQVRLMTGGEPDIAAMSAALPA